MKRQAVAVARQAVAPAAFGRLSVETVFTDTIVSLRHFPAAFGRLSVETIAQLTVNNGKDPSRLRAAVC